MNFAHGSLDIKHLAAFVGLHLCLEAKYNRFCHRSGYASLYDHDFKDLDPDSVRRIKDTSPNLVGLFIVLNGMKVLRDGGG